MSVDAVFTRFVPALPPLTRGAKHFVTPGKIRMTFRLQGNLWAPPECPDTRYVIVDRSWLLNSALHAFIAYKEYIHGLPIEKIYQPDTHDCNAFAMGFCSWLRDCHRLHWQEDLGAAPAVGWGYTNTAVKAPLPKQHAVILYVQQTGSVTKTTLNIYAAEPQAEGSHADYGIVKTHGIRWSHF